MTSMDNILANAIKNIEEKVDSGTSNTASTTNPFKGKWISILGEATSATGGDFSPTGCSGDISDEEKTWWYLLFKKLEANLCINYSDNNMYIANSTATIGAANKHCGTKLHREIGTEYPVLDERDGYRLEEATEEQKPDIVIIYLGMIDYKYNQVLGDTTDSILKSKVASISDYSNISNAYQIILNDVMTTYPDAIIYCISPQTYQYGETTYPYENDEGWSLPQLDELIRKLCIKFGARHISLSHYGIRGTTVGDNEFAYKSSNESLPPLLTEAGHKMLADAIYHEMINDPVCWNTRNDI